jgi:hypothetical protein
LFLLFSFYPFAFSFSPASFSKSWHLLLLVGKLGLVTILTNEVAYVVFTIENNFNLIATESKLCLPTNEKLTCKLE